MAWIIGRKQPQYQPAHCRHCGRACASSQGALAHERCCPARPAPVTAPAPVAALPQPQSTGVLDLLHRTTDPKRQRTLRWYYLKLRWLELERNQKNHTT